MTYTTNYHLNKPAGSDYINIADLNDNMDTLDAALWQVEQDTAANTNTIAVGTFFPISQQVVASSGDVDVSLASITWADWREVVIWCKGGPTTNGHVDVLLNTLTDGGSPTSDMYCQPVAFFSNIPVGMNGCAGRAYFQAGSVPLHSEFRITLFPDKDGTNLVRVRMEGPVNPSYGGSETLAYSSLSKIVLHGVNPFDLSGATISVMGVH